MFNPTLKTDHIKFDVKIEVYLYFQDSLFLYSYYMRFDNMKIRGCGMFTTKIFNKEEVYKATLFYIYIL